MDQRPASVDTMTSIAGATYVSKCLELAVLLEISAHKPGNVSIVTDFNGTSFEHFLASAVVAAPSFESGAKKGIAVRKKEMSVSQVGVGQIIKNCIANINAWQHGGNTLLGTAILLSPISVAAGMTLMRENIVETENLRKNLRLVVESTTSKDAVDVYEAVRIANPGGLGKSPELDVNDPLSIRRILDEKITLYQVFEIASKYDAVCSEWTNNYTITFDLAHPTLTDAIAGSRDLETAIIQTFLKVLAKNPDTFIARKTSIEKAREVSAKAEEILHLGGLETSNGRRRLKKFDQELRSSDNLLNPGTTADIVAASLALTILSGFRP